MRLFCVIPKIFFLFPLLLTFFPIAGIWKPLSSFGIGLFVYQSLDAIDGKQARRTGTSGPLGELFDHGKQLQPDTIVVVFCCFLRRWHVDDDENCQGRVGWIDPFLLAPLICFPQKTPFWPTLLFYFLLYPFLFVPVIWTYTLVSSNPDRGYLAMMYRMRRIEHFCKSHKENMNDEHGKAC